MEINENEKRVRLRDLGIKIGRLKTGPNNAITDVAGVKIGHATIIEGQGGQGVEGVVRTGVTAIIPHEKIWDASVFAGCSALNGNGEMTGTAWINESGLLTTPICLTNTHSVGVVRDAMISYYHDKIGAEGDYWSLPVTAETWDGWLSDINGMHVKKEHVYSALDSAKAGPVEEGAVGGGTGMMCHEFKAGIGTASRVLAEEDGGYTVGVLVQANYGLRYQLRLDGYPIGSKISVDEVPGKNQDKNLTRRPLQEDQGSIIITVATSAPLLPSQCRRLARRAGMGLARVGSIAADSSGDLFIAFSTGNKIKAPADSDQNPTFAVNAMHHDRMTPLFEAVVESVEEAIWNSLCMAETLPGIRGRIGYEIPLSRLRDIVEAQKK